MAVKGVRVKESQSDYTAYPLWVMGMPGLIPVWRKAMGCCPVYPGHGLSQKN